MGLTPQLAAKGVLVLGSGAVAAIALVGLDEWLGNWVGPVWLLAPLFLGFFVGLALGEHGTGRRGAIWGAAAGAALVLVPSGVALIFIAVAGQDLGSAVTERDLPRLWLAFIPLAMLHASISATTGGEARLFLRLRSRR